MPRPVALVTGASAGIGKVFAQRLAARGHDLILVARDAGRLAELAAELTAAYGVQAEALAADLSVGADIRRVGDRIAAEPRLAVLVNNAGFGSKGRVATADMRVQEAMLAVHVNAPMLHTRAALAGMIERGHGWIITVSSVASFTWSAGNANYCATKAYQRVFMEAVGLEVAGTGVRVQALCPGYTYSEFHDRLGTGRSHAPKWLWFPAERIVDESLAQVERGGPVVCVPTKRFKAIVWILKYAQWALGPMRARYARSRGA
ncbi:MAG: SDR family NAD(P)-dependent oxidoreductase [Gemmatimonadetes bacterium]|nr:SDR family NAD(P)-dependent oxidoreductase [Gemmatimonadota bacterium]